MNCKAAARPACRNHGRDEAFLNAARLRREYSGWDIWADRVRDGWAIEAVPLEDDGCPSAVIGSAAEVEAEIRQAQQ